MYNNTNKHKKTEARFGSLLQPPTWICNGPILKKVVRSESK